jgi:hypothetical protein
MACAGALLAPTGLAQAKDRDRDGMSDRWERQHRLSTKRDDARRDPDRDRLSNLREFRSGTDPRDSDSDNDGTRDGKEAGSVVSLAGGILTLKLLDGSEVAAAFDDSTRLKCENEGTGTPTAAAASNGDDDGPGHDAGDDHGGSAGSSSGRGGDDGPGHDAGDDRGGESGSGRGGDDDRNDDNSSGGGDRSRTCPAGALAPGAKVQEAELDITAAGKHWEEIELR